MKLVRYFEGEKKSKLSLLNIKQKLPEHIYGIMTIMTTIQLLFESRCTPRIQIVKFLPSTKCALDLSVSKIFTVINNLTYFNKSSERLFWVFLFAW